MLVHSHEEFTVGDLKIELQHWVIHTLSRRAALNVHISSWEEWMNRYLCVCVCVCVYVSAFVGCYWCSVCVWSVSELSFYLMI